MAFIKRQGNTLDFVATNNQNVNTKRQVFEPSISQNVKPSIENIDVSGIKNTEHTPESFIDD
jgi:hypothetical protein